MLQFQDWVNRTLDSIARTLDEWIEVMCTREFWIIAAICAAIIGVLTAAMITLTDYGTSDRFFKSLKTCSQASNISTFLMINLSLAFVFCGLLVMGEVFNYFDDSKRGIPHSLGSIFLILGIDMAMGIAGLVLVKLFC